MTGRIDQAHRLRPDGVPDHRIVFQPLVSAESGSVVGYEALARFADRRPPVDHLAAPPCGLIELELALARSAVAAAAAIPARYAVTINLSAETIAEPAMREILSAGRRWGIELLETSILDAGSRVRELVDDLGAMLLVDDAGADHAGIDRVLELRPDIVKIDKSIVWGACPDEHGVADPALTARLHAFVAAARRVGARTLAEGVETERHRRVAIDAGIDYAQGYLHGEPVTYGG